MPNQRVSEDIKAAAIADLMAGDQPAIVAQRYGVNRNTVQQWKQRMSPLLSPNMSTIVSPEATIIHRPTTEQRQVRISELIIEVLEARLEAQLAITRHVQTNDTWLAKQTAADLAALDGHLHRTAVDVLDRLAGKRSASNEEGDENTASD